MADTLRLRIVTPERLLLDEDVDEATAPGAAGEFGVFPNHTTFLSSLQPGRLIYKQGGQTQTLVVGGGFAEVVDNIMTVLTNSAETAQEIKLEQARTELRNAEDALKTLAPVDPAFPDMQAAFRLAQARIDMAGGGRPA